jgi:hypothetical protein
MIRVDVQESQRVVRYALQGENRYRYVCAVKIGDWDWIVEPNARSFIIGSVGVNGGVPNLATKTNNILVGNSLVIGLDGEEYIDKRPILDVDAAFLMPIRFGIFKNLEHKLR